MKIVFTPDWFLGSDVLIEIFSFIILSLFFYLSVKAYRLSKNKNSLYLGIGFLLIAIAELATIFTKLVLYYDTSFTQSIGRAVITYQVVKSVDIFYYIGFFFHKLFTLLGLYVICRLPLKKKAIGDFLLAVYFLSLSALFSHSIYYLFHLTALFLLGFIINNYYGVYKKNRSINTKILVIAFGMLAVSQIFFLISKVGIIYVFAQVIQLVSYITLLILITRVLRYGKNGKKKK